MKGIVLHKSARCVLVEDVIQKGDGQQMLPFDKDWAEGWRVWHAPYLLLEKAMAA